MLGEPVVTVLPITHSPPSDRSGAMEIPQETKRRLGLDSERSWIVTTEANRFFWPGPDLRPTDAGRPESIAYGLLPRGLYCQIRDALAAAIESRRGGVVPRSE